MRSQGQPAKSSLGSSRRRLLKPRASTWPWPVFARWSVKATQAAPYLKTPTHLRPSAWGHSAPLPPNPQAWPSRTPASSSACCVRRKLSRSHCIMLGLHPSGFAGSATPSSRPTVRGSATVAGGPPRSGDRSNGTSSPAIPAAPCSAAAWCIISSTTSGRWWRSMTEQYVELHAASAFSFLEGASQPEALIERAASLGMPAIALLDRNGLYGAARFHTSAQRSGITAHIGAEISVASLGHRLTPPAWLPHQHPAEPARLPLLCASREGYQNLCQLITQFKMRETTKGDGAAHCGDLAQYARGLVCMTGGDEGPLAAALARGGEAEGREAVEKLIRIFGPENVYVELQRHHLREQEWRNQAAVRIATSFRLPVLATN